MKYLVLVIVIIFIYLIVTKLTKKPAKQKVSRNTNNISNSVTTSSADKNYKIIVKRKRKEDKKWEFWKEITVQAYNDYTALTEASYIIAKTDNPRINQANIKISATVVLRSQNISYRFEIKE